jgi:hypothetical protein
MGNMLRFPAAALGPCRPAKGGTRAQVFSTQRSLLAMGVSAGNHGPVRAREQADTISPCPASPRPRASRLGIPSWRRIGFKGFWKD